MVVAISAETWPNLVGISQILWNVLKGEFRKDQDSLVEERTAENAPTRTSVGQIWTINIFEAWRKKKISRSCLLALHYQVPAGPGLWLAHRCYLRFTRLEPQFHRIVFSARRFEKATPKRPSIVKCLAVKGQPKMHFTDVFLFSFFSGACVYPEDAAKCRKSEEGHEKIPQQLDLS